ncbi:hypothetical protein GQ600_18498 [Phytophthora cactorum]|nr:hypothetical protein GQ600_18498 [Phytophthora cactorum]
MHRTEQVGRVVVHFFLNNSKGSFMSGRGKGVLATNPPPSCSSRRSQAHVGTDLPANESRAQILRSKPRTRRFEAH